MKKVGLVIACAFAIFFCSCTYEDKELITEPDGFMYYKCLKPQDHFKKGIKDLDKKVIVPTEMKEIRYIFVSKGNLSKFEDIKQPWRLFRCVTEDGYAALYTHNGRSIISPNEGYNGFGCYYHEDWIGLHLSDDGIHCGYYKYSKEWHSLDEILPQQFTEIKEKGIHRYRLEKTDEISHDLMEDKYYRGYRLTAIDIDGIVLLCTEKHDDLSFMSVYDTDGNCIISSDKKYYRIKLEDRMHLVSDDNRYFFYCYKKDSKGESVVDIRLANGKLSSSIPDVYFKIMFNDDRPIDEYYYCAIGWGVGRPNYYLSYRSGSQRIILDIYGKCICSIDEDDRFGYNRGGFYRIYDDEYIERKIWLNKWLDKDYHVTNTEY